MDFYKTWESSVSKIVDKLYFYFRILDISGCHQGVTDTGVISLAKLPSLHSLTLSYLNKVKYDTGVITPDKTPDKIP